MDKTHDAIKKMIEESGNSFHYKVVRLLRENEWNTIVSPYYSDNFTNKAREVDIVAYKTYTNHDVIRKYTGNICLRLFIECKYIKNNIVFWFDEKDVEKASGRVKNDMLFSDETAAVTHHRYVSACKVAKLFYSNAKGPDSDQIYKAISQCLNSMIYYKNREFNESGIGVSRIINYPLIICNSFEKFFYVECDDYENIKPINDTFQIEVNYSYIGINNRSVDEYFIIEVVSYETLKNFLNNSLSSDASRILNSLFYKHRSKSR